MLGHAVPLMLGGYLWDFARSVLALVGALGLAWLLLRVLGKRTAGQAQGPLQVLQRVALDPRARLYVVRVGERTLLIGSGDGAAPRLLTELPAELLTELPADKPSPAGTLGSAAGQVTRDDPPSAGRKPGESS